MTSLSTVQPPTLEMPVADGVPVLGSALALLKNPLEFMKEQARKQGPVFRVNAGPRKMVVLSGVDANRFFTEEGKDCFQSEAFWGRITRHWRCPHFISAMDGEEHTQYRKALRPSFSRMSANTNQDALIQIIHDTVDDYAGSGTSFSARSLTRTLTNSELFLLMTGEMPWVDKDTAYSMAQYQRMTFNVLALGKWPKPMLWTPQYFLHRRRALKMVRKLQQQHAINPPESGYFAIVQQLRKRASDWTRGDDDFMYLAPFWAGLDTLGASLTFLLQEALLRPELLSQIRAELDDSCAANDGKIPDNDSLRKLPILNGFCMEILRLFPVAFSNPRGAARDFEFAGYEIKKGEQVMIFTTATHFDPQYFPDPEKLDVHRHGPERHETKPRYVFNPYGRGPHICLGAGMAESMLLTTAATLFRDFDIVAADPGKRHAMIFDPSPTLPSAFEIRMTPRQSHTLKQ